jgi:hypothetical protein
MLLGIFPNHYTDYITGYPATILSMTTVLAAKDAAGY